MDGGNKMNTHTGAEPWWAALAIWGVVNSVNILQGAGFLSRLRTGSLAANHILGFVIIALAIPAAVALVAFFRTKAPWQYWIGAAVFLLFILFMLAVDYIWPVEFRSPARSEILVPYLLLFFGAILLMGLPMFHLDRRLWWVTLATTVFLLGSMGIAMRKGVG